MSYRWRTIKIRLDYEKAVAVLRRKELLTAAAINSSYRAEMSIVDVFES